MQSSKPLKVVSPLDVEGYVKTIVDDIILAKLRLTDIVPVGSGGLIPGAMIAYEYNMRMGVNLNIEVIYAESYHGQYRQLPEIYWPAGITVGGLRARGASVLIVDDIADSGETLKYLLRGLDCATTATLIHKENSVIKPDFCGHVDKDGDKWWWQFPWEQS